MKANWSTVNGVVEIDGYVKIYRAMLDHPVVTKDAETWAVWSYILLSATHKPKDVLFGGKRITLKPGQLLTGRNKIAEKFNISSSKVQRILKTLESEQQIEQQMGAKNRVITVKNWCKYQLTEQVSEQQVNSKWTASEQQVNTYKNKKKYKNISPPVDPPLKREYGEFKKVKLTDNEYERLVQRLGKDETGKYIVRLDGWLAEGNTKKNHYATILNWVRKDAEKKAEKAAEKQPASRSYSLTDIEQKFNNFD